MSKKAKHIRILLVCSVFFIIACQRGQNDSEKIKKSDGDVNGQVIYGDDDRLDYYQVTNQDALRLARSTVALVKNSQLTTSGATTQISGQNFGSAYNLCASEPYRAQTTAAFCSGALIAPNLVLTAGHCITNASDCSQTSFVFGFYLDRPGINSVDMVASQNVYRCQNVLHTQHPSAGADFAVIQLDRAVSDHTPLPIRNSGSLQVGDDLLVIGHPAGLPLKVAGGAKVRSITSSGYLVANLDTYGGNSGSAVFNAHTGIIEGVLVRGENDFVPQGSCNVSNRCTNDGCRGEDVTLISEVLPFLPVANPTPTPPPTPTPVPTPVPTPQGEESFSAKPNLSIPDNSATGVMSAVNVSSKPNGRKVLVYVNITHTWIGDLTVTLTAPDSKKIVLTKLSGGFRDNIVGTYGVELQSKEDLRTLSNVSLSGVWKLSVTDTVARDVGKFNEWRLIFK